MASQKKKVKIKVKPIPVAILCATIILITAGIIWVVVANKPKEDNTVNIGISKVDTDKGSVEEKVTQATEISIDIDNTAVPIGMTFMVTATVEPIDTSDAIKWTTSDENVLIVDKNGLVTIKGTGTAALTATIGNASDAVVIEGIENSSSVSQNNLPVYTGGSWNTGEADNQGSTGSTGNAGGTDTSGTGNSGDTGGKDSSGNTSSQGGSNGSGNSDSAGNSDSSGNADSSGNSDSAGDSDNTGNAGNSGNNQSDNDGDGMSSNDLYGVLPDIGYSRIYSNVYIYEDNNTYYGEIIIQPNLTIIYIKERSDVYDEMVKAVIEKLLPGRTSQIWNNYISAGSDRTFEIDDRMVRIVSAIKGGHSQIVIYN